LKIVVVSPVRSLRTAQHHRVSLTQVIATFRTDLSVRDELQVSRDDYGTG
jgi:hypothetical protein